MSRRRVSLTALLTVGLTLPLLAAPTATAASKSIDDLFVCESIRGENFCTDMGSISPEAERAVRKEFAAAASGRGADAPGAGDTGVAGILESLTAMTPAELAAHQDARLKDARQSAGTGDAPAAVEARSGTAPLAATTTATGDVVVSRMRGFTTKSFKQEKDNWCGPATMALIGRGNGVTKSQETRAGTLGTTVDGTAMSNIVSTINEYRSWWHPQGAYSVVNVSGSSLADFKSKIQLRIGWDRPVVLHPTLRTEYFDHIKPNHGGHFQPGYGYSSDDILFIEVYNEKDFYPKSGADSAGYKRTTWRKALNSTTHTTTVVLRTLGL